mgnify:CR=1 FL=1|tara:strand:- start:18382 stop:19224 length:843 start_codon:yes stop_codon:yes gene_type:complete
MSKKFILVSNQRCGSTWFITSVGNCDKVITDFEVKWSKELLLGKQSPYHLFLKDNSFYNIFNENSFSGENILVGTKFVFDFYKQFPPEHYLDFINKFQGYPIIHLQRDYIDVLRSKLIGKVTHLLNTQYLEKNRLIDKTIFAKQNEYINIIENSKKNKKTISFNVANTYLINLFINDVMTLSLKKTNDLLTIDYEEIKQNLDKISNFLNLSKEDLNKNFFKKSTILKNKTKHDYDFENLDDLKKINKKLKNKLKFLNNNIFNFKDIVSYDKLSKKININL